MRPKHWKPLCCIARKKSFTVSIDGGALTYSFELTVYEKRPDFYDVLPPEYIPSIPDTVSVGYTFTPIFIGDVFSFFPNHFDRILGYKEDFGDECFEGDIIDDDFRFVAVRPGQARVQIKFHVLNAEYTIVDKIVTVVAPEESLSTHEQNTIAPASGVSDVLHSDDSFFNQTLTEPNPIYGTESYFDELKEDILESHWPEPDSGGEVPEVQNIS